MSIEVKECRKNGLVFQGLYEIQPKVFGDTRGYFVESYNSNELMAHNIKFSIVQTNQSLSQKDVVRGLHFQKKHTQAKLVHCVYGIVYDVAVDLRKDSATFGLYYGVKLDSKKCNLFLIPKGFAHGFAVLSETAIFAYDCTDFYDPASEDGIIWNDKTLAINWQEIIGNTTPILSKKDTAHEAFAFDKIYFDMAGNWQGD